MKEISLICIIGKALDCFEVKIRSKEVYCRGRQLSGDKDSK